ncbi:DUF6452 family protein [Flavobacterium sp. WW92]|uniref:DUF6452 family protein n=1 Tax=unclassified Flavobacterium TaxID=196869 RepID=UPI0022249C27|nr:MULTISPECIES: DUF6452 family protein [unclassified Flavobacterium]WDO12577.1 DUF6452 family protein [Flavobacterium sp. WW92]
MKKFHTIIASLFIAVCFFGCEKDDICSGTTPTTPRLIIEFYEKDNPSVLKTVTNLKAVAVDGSPNGVVFNDILLSTDPNRYLANSNKIGLPLKINGETTEYTLTLNSTSTNPAIRNADKITFNYTTKEIYVSRACGYKTNFDLTGSPIQEPNAVDSNKWINNIIVETPNIETENEIHIKIYF